MATINHTDIHQSCKCSQQRTRGVETLDLAYIEFTNRSTTPETIQGSGILPLDGLLSIS